ncbi:MAG: hypothetical protein EA355_04955 [Rhodobacteraceae bacterium]|nr:MAG: hypothetical protein EA355_04955 [Paracoccaceae bacterium]
MADLAGLWRRTLYVAPDGRRDTESRVFWLQAGDLCGDIRAPGPAAAAETAFAGRLERVGDVFGWRFEQAWGYPPDAPPDEGRLRWEGDILREDGVHAPYLEHWRRETAEIVRAGRFEGGLLIETREIACAARAGRFLLAARRGPRWTAMLAANADVAPGGPVDWPEVEGGAIRFPAGPLGPAAVSPFTPTPA